MRDAHYTASDIARVLAGSINLSPHKVADFACGDGSLLEAASVRWPSSKLFGVDIEPAVEPALRSRVPNASFLAMDFLSCEMPNVDLLGRFDAILLNPPFSCPGSRTDKALLAGSLLHCSRAMAFTVKALHYLANDGAMVALLPNSCLFSDKDAVAREALGHLFHLEVVSLSNPPQFRGCSVNTVVVVLRRRATPELTQAPARVRSSEANFQIVRGARPNRTAIGVSALAPFVHTTELRDNCIKFARLVSAHSRDRLVVGPAIIIPRVGRPRLDKICFLAKDQSLRMSDCIIAIKHPQPEVLTATYDAMHANWQALHRLYQGTCAAYVTVARLRAYLSTLVDSGEVAAAA